MKPVAYTYEADYHCPDCAKRRFPPDEYGNCYGVDGEGNEIHSIFSWDEFIDADIVCSDCREEIYVRLNPFRLDDEF